MFDTGKPRTNDTPNEYRRQHQTRHREMAWQPDPSPDCIEDLIQAAQASGDEYLTALLTSAARRLSRFIP